MLVGVEGSLGVGVVFFLGIFGMAVEVALIFIGTLVFLTRYISLDLNFR